MTAAGKGLNSLDENERREYWAALALRCMRGLGIRSVCSLLRHYGSAYAAYAARGRWEEAGVSIPGNMHEAEDAWRARAKPEWDAARKTGASIILWTDPLYPRQLSELEDAPALLYALGRLELLAAPMVAIVGSRECSQAAADMASAVAGGLSAMGVSVVSGMARGADSYAHAAAMRGEGKSVAVLGTGVDVSYPASNTGLYRKLAESGLVVSELPPGCPARPGAFPVRNRIVSGLSMGVFVAEAASPQSGSLITARHAADHGRSVYVPSPDSLSGPYREGTRLLLMEGAQPVSSAEHIVADLFPQLLPHAQPLRKEVPAGASGEEAGAAAGQKPSSPEGGTGMREEAQAGGWEEPAGPSAPEEAIRRYPLKEKPILAKPRSSSVPQTEEEEALLSILDRGPVSADDLLQEARESDPRMNWTAASVSAVLMVLEVKGLARRRADSRYEPAR
jgi:DNA processing protein